MEGKTIGLGCYSTHHKVRKKECLNPRKVGLGEALGTDLPNYEITEQKNKLLRESF